MRNIEAHGANVTLAEHHFVLVVMNARQRTMCVAVLTTTARPHEPPPLYATTL